MSTDTLVLVLVSSNLACGFLGFLFGRMTRAAVEIEDHMSAEAKDVAARKCRFNLLHIIALAVVFIGVTTAVFGIVVIRNQDRLSEQQIRMAECVVTYSDDLAEALKHRSDAQLEVNTQLDNVMSAFLTAFSDEPSVGRARVFDAIDAYNKARTQAKEAQRENPLPEAPRSACAELTE